MLHRFLTIFGQFFYDKIEYYGQDKPYTK